MKKIFTKLCFLTFPFVLAAALGAAETNVADTVVPPPEAPQPPTATNVKPSITGDQIVEISKSAMNRRSRGPETLIPVVAILSVFGFPVVFLIVLVRYKANKEKRLHETIRLMIEKGTPIPPELLTSERNQPLDKHARKRGNDFRKGIHDVVFGIGAMIVISLLPISRFWPIGLIFIFIGAARLICWKVEKKTAQQDK